MGVSSVFWLRGLFKLKKCLQKFKLMAFFLAELSDK